MTTTNHHSHADATACPAWCTGIHDGDFHDSYLIDRWDVEQVENCSTGAGEAKVYVNAFAGEDGVVYPTTVVVQGRLAESQDCAEITPADAVRLARALLAAVQTATGCPHRHPWCVKAVDAENDHGDSCASRIHDLAGSTGPDVLKEGGVYAEGWGAWLHWSEHHGLLVQFDGGDQDELALAVPRGTMPALRPIDVAVVLAATATPEAREALVGLLLEADPEIPVK